ncbi:hypothetical protein NDU88_000806 [Pleurodeles waltl]|uniref:Uncharacterized protein n=1 Tax=Pleurodeles waltl TaxID=8319 RepID=A0AAV7S5M5_PLEWA|nr:hypothetical protein NDU88_000806 [Pleurodeles waltl]
MNRPVGDTILQCDAPTTLQEQASERLHQRKSANGRVSRRRRARSAHPQVGDQVLVRNRHPGGKFRLPFEMTPWTLMRRKGTLVTAQKDRELVTQNISFIKRYQSDIDTTANDLLLPTPDHDGGESGTSRLGASDQEVHTPRGGCGDNQESPHGTKPEGGEDDELAETWEPSMVHECVVSNPPRGGTERYHLRPRPLPSSKMGTFWSSEVMWVGGAKETVDLRYWT